MKYTLIFYDDNIIGLVSEKKVRGCYENTESGRQKVKKIFDENEVFKKVNGKFERASLEEDIFPIWGDSATISIDQVPIEEIRSKKQQQIKNICHNKIVAGVDVDIGLQTDDGEPAGELHYSLTERKQTDMHDLAESISKGATQVTWRDESRVTHQIYTADQFMKLYNAANDHILRCRYLSDALEELLFSYSDNEEDKIKALNWDTELPTEIKERMENLISVMLEK